MATNSFTIDTVLQNVTPQGDTRRVLMIQDVGIVSIDFKGPVPDWRNNDKLKITFEASRDEPKA